MSHYNQQRSCGIPHTVQAWGQSGHHRLEKLIPSHGKVFNPFVAFFRSRKTKQTKNKEKKGGRVGDWITAISLSCCDNFRVNFLFFTLFLHVNSMRSSHLGSQARANAAVLFYWAGHPWREQGPCVMSCHLVTWEQGRGGRGAESGLGDKRGGAASQGPLSVPMKLGEEEHSVPGADWQ